MHVDIIKKKPLMINHVYNIIVIILYIKFGTVYNEITILFLFIHELQFYLL